MTFLERRVPDVTGEVLARHRLMVDIVPTEEKAKIIEVLSADKLRQAFKGVFHWAVRFVENVTMFVGVPSSLAETDP